MDHLPGDSACEGAAARAVLKGVAAIPCRIFQSACRPPESFSAPIIRRTLETGRGCCHNLVGAPHGEGSLRSTPGDEGPGFRERPGQGNQLRNQPQRVARRSAIYPQPIGRVGTEIGEQGIEAFWRCGSRIVAPVVCRFIAFRVIRWLRGRRPRQPPTPPSTGARPGRFANAFESEDRHNLGIPSWEGGPQTRTFAPGSRLMGVGDSFDVSRRLPAKAAPGQRAGAVDNRLRAAVQDCGPGFRGLLSEAAPWQNQTTSATAPPFPLSDLLPCRLPGCTPCAGVPVGPKSHRKGSGRWNGVGDFPYK